MRIKELKIKELKVKALNLSSNPPYYYFQTLISSSVPSTNVSVLDA